MSVILIDSVYRKDKNYYSQVFLGKYNDSDDSYNDDSDKKILMILMKKIKCINLFEEEILEIVFQVLQVPS